MQAINNLAAAIGGTKVQPQAPTASVQPTPPAVTPANGAATNAQFTGTVSAPAPILPHPAIPTAPAAYPSPITTTTSSAQQVFPSNPATPTAVSVPGVPLAQPPQYTVDQIMAAGAALMQGNSIY